MKLLHNIIRAIERNSRQNERHQLVEELDDLYAARDYDSPRIVQIIERLNVLNRDDLQAYMERNQPIKSVSQMVEDAGVPDGLAGEWKAPA